MGALTPFGGIQDELRQMTHEEHRRVGWSVLWNVATAQLRQKRSVVLDGVAREVEVAGTRGVARAVGATAVVALTSCRNIAVHRTRIDGRTRNIPGWHELDWDHVEQFMSRWLPPRDVDLELDACDPYEANITRLIDRLRATG
jgi:hypothetical protein